MSGRIDHAVKKFIRCKTKSRNQRDPQPIPRQRDLTLQSYRTRLELGVVGETISSRIVVHKGWSLMINTKGSLVQATSCPSDGDYKMGIPCQVLDGQVRRAELLIQQSVKSGNFRQFPILFGKFRFEPFSLANVGTPIFQKRPQ